MCAAAKVQRWTDSNDAVPGEADGRFFRSGVFFGRFSRPIGSEAPTDECHRIERRKDCAMSKSTWISEWKPEDVVFWNTKGKAIARRNLIWSIVAEHLAFSIWLIWSIVATKLPQAGFHYTTEQLFQLVALPGLIGSLMRFPYTFAVTTFG